MDRKYTFISNHTSFSVSRREMHVYFDASTQMYGFRVFSTNTGLPFYHSDKQYSRLMTAVDAGTVKTLELRDRSLFDEMCDLEAEHDCTISH
jgi:hypothetical protein